MKNRSDNLVFSILQEHPSVAAGVCTFAVAFALVAGNAIYAQPGSHPVPLLATRDHVTTQSVQAPSVFKPEVRVVNTIFIKPKVIPTPTSRNSVVNAKQQLKSIEPAVVASRLAASRLVANIQDALKGTGDYNGDIDGVYGPVTRSSIVKYQARNGLNTDGEASQNLLKIIRINKPRMVSNSSNDQIAKLLTVSNSSMSAPMQNQYNPDLVYKIQKGLVNFGEPGISVDGIFGQRTSAAISRFQQKFNLPVTSKPDSMVLETLIAKKALTRG